MRRIVVLLLAAALSFPALAPAAPDKKKKKPKDDVEAIGERDVGGGLNFYNIEKEIALGKQLADEVERSAKIVRDPLIAEYVNRVGQNLARNSDGQVPFHFKVIESPQVNAFALPGGFLFVNTGLIEEAETEGELAGVLAHEIAHVTARHGTRQATRGQLANLATIPLMVMTGGGWTGYAIYQAAGLAIPMTFLQFSRKFEREADYLGLQYLYKAGYDPTAFIDFFERLQALEKRKPGALAQVFRSHPMTDDRIAAAQKEIEEILPPRREYLVSTSEFTNVKERLLWQLALQRSGEAEEAERDGPVLRRGSAGGKIPVEADSGEGSAPDDDEPPVLTRGDSGDSGDEDLPTLKRGEAQE